METGGYQAGEHTGNVGTVLGGIEQLVFALSDEELQGPLDQVVVQRRASIAKNRVSVSQWVCI